MSVPLILLAEGTEQAQGKRQIVSNIQACMAIADSVRTTLGPRGMDKIMVDDGGKMTVSNDGATILKLLDVAYPAAKILVDIAKSQDAEVGDGTTTVVLLATELLKKAKPFIEDGVHPQTIVKAYRKGANLALSHLAELSVKVDAGSESEKRELLVKCAQTALTSKLVSQDSRYFAEMVVDAVHYLFQGADERKLMPLKMIGIKKVHGASLVNSQLVRGVAFKKTFSYAGFEMQRKSYENPMVALLNVELELKAEKENADMRIGNVQEYQQIVDAEWKILYDKLQTIADSGAKVVLSKLPIGDVATQWFADRDMFCAGRVSEEDLERVMFACGGSIATSLNKLAQDQLGHCDQFYEEQVGNERYNFFVGGAVHRACTIILRGGAEQFIDEMERSLHDAIMIVRRAVKNDAVVAGGGAIDMELSKHVRSVALKIPGKEQLLLMAFARCFEIIPQQLCHNAGIDATDYLNNLRKNHAEGKKWMGIDVKNEQIVDNMDRCVWEPMLVKKNAIIAASEAACMILSVDETIKNPGTTSALQG